MATAESFSSSAESFRSSVESFCSTAHKTIGADKSLYSMYMID